MPMPAPPMHVRLTHDLGETDVLEGRMEMSPDGRSWSRLFDAGYRRVADGDGA